MAKPLANRVPLPRPDVTFSNKDTGQASKAGFDWMNGVQSGLDRIKKGIYVTPYDFNGVGDGVKDDTAAVVAAFATGHHVDLANSTFLVEPDAIVFNAFQWLQNGKLLKATDGDFLDMSAQQSGLFHVDIDCNSKNGRGVIIGGDGALALHRQVMIRAFVTNSVGYSLEFTAAHSGGIFSAHDCAFTRTVSTNPGVRLPVDTLLTFAGRWFHNMQQGGNHLIELNGGISTRLLGGNTTGIVWDAATQQVYIEDYRMAGAYTVKGAGTVIRGSLISGPLTLQGTQHTVSDNVMQGGSIVLDSALTQSEIRINDAVLTDNTSGQLSNRIYGHTAAIVPVWTSTGVAPAIGNGTLSGTAGNEGHLLKLRLELLFGTTTTIGTGAWQFTAPAPFNRFSTARGVAGIATFFDTSTSTLYTGVAIMNAGVATILIGTGGPAGSANFWGGSGPVPVTPANGDVLTIDMLINYGT